jgi:uncharacterized protein (DUF488 family)
MDGVAAASARRLYSIGHSNHPLELFLGLLKRHEIEVLVDVRSQPYSRYASQFDAEVLRQAIIAAGLKYVYLGRELGGRPEGTEFYDAEGHVLYARVAGSPLFLQGIRRLENGLEKFRAAMMCSEEDPARCHRHLLIARVLADRGIGVDHIRGDGQIQDEAKLRAEAVSRHDRGQLQLFAEPEEGAWRSIRAVLPRKPRPNSSEP